MNYYIKFFIILIIGLLSNNLEAQVFKKIQSDGDGKPTCPQWTGIVEISQFVVFTNLEFEEGQGCQPIVNAPCDMSVGIYVPYLNETFYQELTSCDFKEPYLLNGELVYEGSVNFTVDLSHLDLCSESTNGLLYFEYEVDLYCGDGQGYFESINFCSKHLVPGGPSPWDGILSPNVFNELDCSQKTNKKRCFKCLYELPPSDNDRDQNNDEDEGESFGKSKSTNLDLEAKTLFAEDGFTIQLISGSYSPVNVKVFNVSGQSIKDQYLDYYNPLKTNLINVNGLEKGFYVIMITQDNKISTIKAVVQ